MYKRGMSFTFVHKADSNVYRIGKSYPITGLNRPLGLQEIQDPRISRQSAHKVGNVVSPTHRPSLPSGKISGTHFC